jgi:hypothetical protein
MLDEEIGGEMGKIHVEVALEINIGNHVTQEVTPQRCLIRSQ